MGWLCDLTGTAGVDDGFESWIGWRAACAGVEAAYRRWTTAHREDRAVAFADYRAALAREEEHADRYAGLMTPGAVMNVPAGARS